MFGNFTHRTPSQGQSLGVGVGVGVGSPVGTQQQQQVSELPTLSNIITSDVKAQEPPLVTVTSDLPEHGGSPSPRPTKRALHTSPRAAGSTTPRRPRLEVVLNVSPYKPLPGQSLWAEADLDDDEDELVAPDVEPSRQNDAAHTFAGSSHHKAERPPAPTQITGKRPRGRPKGWRPGMPSTKTGLPTASVLKYLDKNGNRVMPPHSSVAPKNTGQKRRGRPPRAPSPTPRELWERLEPPRYVPFICEWKGCKAELQNMETMRRHVRKLHGLRTGNDGLVCRWGRCGRQEQGQQQIFTAEGFHEHMEERHLVPLVWHVGDGVRNEKLISAGELPTENGDKAPAYLLGPDGEQVTPWVKGQEVEDFLTWRDNRNRLKQILLQRDQNAPLEEDEDEDDEDDEEGDETPPM